MKDYSLNVSIARERQDDDPEMLRNYHRYFGATEVRFWSVAWICGPHHPPEGATSDAVLPDRAPRHGRGADHGVDGPGRAGGRAGRRGAVQHRPARVRGVSLRRGAASAIVGQDRRCQQWRARGGRRTVRRGAGVRRWLLGDRGRRRGCRGPVGHAGVEGTGRPHRGARLSGPAEGAERTPGPYGPGLRAAVVRFGHGNKLHDRALAAPWQRSADRGPPGSSTPGPPATSAGADGCWSGARARRRR